MAKDMDYLLIAFLAFLAVIAMLAFAADGRGVKLAQ